MSVMFHVKHYIFTNKYIMLYNTNKRRFIMFMDKEGMTLATEIFKELKASARRWFIAFCIMCGIELATVAGFLWYISLPTDETVTVENDEGNANYIGGSVGGNINNNKAEAVTEQ